jgi:hypothetical protein
MVDYKKETMVDNAKTDDFITDHKLTEEPMDQGGNIIGEEEKIVSVVNNEDAENITDLIPNDDQTFNVLSHTNKTSDAISNDSILEAVPHDFNDSDNLVTDTNEATKAVNENSILNDNESTERPMEDNERVENMEMNNDKLSNILSDEPNIHLNSENTEIVTTDNGETEKFVSDSNPIEEVESQDENPIDTIPVDEPMISSLHNENAKQLMVDDEAADTAQPDDNLELPNNDNNVENLIDDREKPASTIEENREPLVHNGNTDTSMINSNDTQAPMTDNKTPENLFSDDEQVDFSVDKNTTEQPMTDAIESTNALNDNGKLSDIMDDDQPVTDTQPIDENIVSLGTERSKESLLDNNQMTTDLPVHGDVVGDTIPEEEKPIDTFHADQNLEFIGDNENNQPTTTNDEETTLPDDKSSKLTNNSDNGENLIIHGDNAPNMLAIDENLPLIDATHELVDGNNLTNILPAKENLESTVDTEDAEKLTTDNEISKETSDIDKEALDTIPNYTNIGLPVLNENNTNSMNATKTIANALIDNEEVEDIVSGASNDRENLTLHTEKVPDILFDDDLSDSIEDSENVEKSSIDNQTTANELADNDEGQETTDHDEKIADATSDDINEESVVNSKDTMELTTDDEEVDEFSTYDGPTSKFSVHDEEVVHTSADENGTGGILNDGEATGPISLNKNVEPSVDNDVIETLNTNINSTEDRMIEDEKPTDIIANVNNENLTVDTQNDNKQETGVISDDENNELSTHSENIANGVIDADKITNILPDYQKREDVQSSHQNVSDSIINTDNAEFSTASKSVENLAIDNEKAGEPIIHIKQINETMLLNKKLPTLRMKLPPLNKKLPLLNRQLSPLISDDRSIESLTNAPIMRGSILNRRKPEDVITSSVQTQESTAKFIQTTKTVTKPDDVITGSVQTQETTAKFIQTTKTVTTPDDGSNKSVNTSGSGDQVTIANETLGSVSTNGKKVVIMAAGRKANQQSFLRRPSTIVPDTSKESHMRALPSEKFWRRNQRRVSSMPTLETGQLAQK